MAFAGYSASQQRQLQHQRRKGSRRLVLGCIPATLQNLVLLMLVAGLASVLFASRLISRAEEQEQEQPRSSKQAVGGSNPGGGGGDGGDLPSPSPAFCGRPNPLVCAHGTVGSVDWDEASKGPRPLPNTVPALQLAVAAGHACVEVDVSRTRDGHLVALHSRELKRLTDGRVTNPGDVTLAEVLALKVPGRGAVAPRRIMNDVVKKNRPVDPRQTLGRKRMERLQKNLKRHRRQRDRRLEPSHSSPYTFTRCHYVEGKSSRGDIRGGDGRGSGKTIDPNHDRL